MHSYVSSYVNQCDDNAMSIIDRDDGEVAVVAIVHRHE